MSHFSQIKTQIRNLTSLQSALSDLGMEWKSGPCDVRGYRGDTQAAEVVIEQNNGYDVGLPGTDTNMSWSLTYNIGTSITRLIAF